MIRLSSSRSNSSACFLSLTCSALDMATSASSFLLISCFCLICEAQGGGGRGGGGGGSAAGMAMAEAGLKGEEVSRGEASGEGAGGG